jgi:hypothetical protein
MFKVQVTKADGSQVADTVHETKPKADAYIARHTAKKSWGEGFTTVIENVTAEYAARDAAKVARDAKKSGARAILKNIDASAISDPALKAVVELLQ